MKTFFPLFILVALLLSNNTFSQRLLPTSHNGPWLGAVPPCGWSWNMASSDISGAGANFNAIGRQIRVDFACQPTSLSFVITPNTLNSGVSKEIVVYQLISGVWNTVNTYNWNGTIASPNGLGTLGMPAALSQNLSLDPNATAIMFYMTVRDAGSGNFGISNIAVLGGVGCGEKIVYEDNFSSNCTHTWAGFANMSCTNGVAPNNTKWDYKETDNGNAVAFQFSSGEMRVHNDYNSASSGVSFLNKRLAGNSSIGTNGVYGTYSTSNPNYLNDEFTENCEPIEWSFLIYLSHTPSGLSNGAARFGGAFVLGSEYNNLTLCNTSLRNTGYAVVFGSEASATIQFVRFQSGTSSACATNNYPQYFMNNTFGTNSTTCVVSDNSANLVGGRWYAVKIQYDPSDDRWRMFTRHNVGSSFDPTTLSSSDGRGSNIDNTYTSNWLSYMGLYTSMMPKSPVRRVALKSLKIKKNVSLLSTPAGGGVCVSESALPVKFNNLETNCENGKAKLEWSTFTEINNDYFTIERSIDGYNYDVIAKVKGVGTTSQFTSYEWTDNQQLHDIYYYRLSQTDFDGSSEYLQTVTFNSTSCIDKSFKVSVFPNPIIDNSIIELVLNQETVVSISLIDVTGRIIKEITSKANKDLGVYHFNIDSHCLPTGIYFIKVETDNGGEIIKLIK